MYNFKHHLLTLLYYIAMATRGLLLVVFKPLAFVFSTVDATVSEWTPSKPLHKSADIDYDNPDNYGI